MIYFATIFTAYLVAIIVHALTRAWADTRIKEAIQDLDSKHHKSIKIERVSVPVVNYRSESAVDMMMYREVPMDEIVKRAQHDFLMSIPKEIIKTNIIDRYMIQSRMINHNNYNYPPACIIQLEILLGRPIDY